MSRLRYGATASFCVILLTGCGSASLTPGLGMASVGNRAGVPTSLVLPLAARTADPAPERIANTPDSINNTTGKRQARTTLVVDVDDTVCVTDYNNVIFGFGTDDSRPLPRAAEALRELARNYDIVYLSARPAAVAHRTQRWLDKYQFPRGPVVGSENIGHYIFQTDFKKKMLSRLRRERGNLLIGIADRACDAAAYRANGMLPVVVNPPRGQEYHPDELIFQDWAGVAKFFAANERMLLDPLKLADAIKLGDWAVHSPL